jgi:hypothetical protein
MEHIPSANADDNNDEILEQYFDLDNAWLESENGKLDKKQLLNQVMTIMQEMERKDGATCEILWRASRGESNIASWDPNIDVETKTNHVMHGLEYAKRALASINETATLKVDQSSCHKFVAICLGQKAQLISNPKEQLTLANDISKHITRGIELNPNDPMLWYMRGQWKYSISDIPYSVRYAASWITGTILEATFEDALNDFKQANIIDGAFYCDNQFMMARTMLKLNGNECTDEILDLLNKGISMNVANPSTIILQEKAKKLVSKFS